MTNLEHIRTHIEASAPCSLFSVAAWADSQLNIDAARFVGVIDHLTACDFIRLTYEDCNFVIDLTN
jgi:hypothetical protein